VAAGALARAGRQGPNRAVFSGRVGRRALAPGPYVLTLTATDAAGTTSKPARTRFTIVRP
jgi:hypothetical protein